MFINKTLIVVYNKKTKNYNSETSDFFSQAEIDFIIKIAKQSKYDIEFIEGELTFINSINNYFSDEIVVLNLTRRGSSLNKKSAVTALCDLKQITTIGSSSLTMNLCRQKNYLNPLLSTIGIQYPNTHTDTANLKKEQNYIVKNINSAGSLGLCTSSIKCGAELQGKPLDDALLIQEYIEGYELEVPFIIIDSKIQILGIYSLQIEEFSYFSTENIALLDYSHSDNFNYKINHISVDENTFTQLTECVQQISDLLHIENYGRIDFRTSNINNFMDYYLFDIATSPFFTENSSFFYGCKDNVFDMLLSTL